MHKIKIFYAISLILNQENFSCWKLLNRNSVSNSKFSLLVKNFPKNRFLFILKIMFKVYMINFYSIISFNFIIFVLVIIDLNETYNWQKTIWVNI